MERNVSSNYEYHGTTLEQAARNTATSLKQNRIRRKAAYTTFVFADISRKMGDVLHICLLVRGSESSFVEDNRLGWIANYRCADGHFEVGINFAGRVNTWIFDPRFP